MEPHRRVRSQSGVSREAMSWMQRRQTNRRHSIRALNSSETLVELANRDLWQLELVTKNGCNLGRVIRQVVEPGMYTIRYFIVYNVAADRHILIPANSIIDITEDRVLCNLNEKDVAALPSFLQSVSRSYEEEIHTILAQTPYWVEEADVLGQPESKGDNS